MDAQAYHPAVSSALSYRDPRAALHWLEAAFGFEPSMVIVDSDENPVHIEMRFGDGLIMVGSEWSDDHRSPASLGGKNTQTVHLQLPPDVDVDAHCERARKAGARILAEPADQFYGDRAYRAVDPEGHIWSVSKTVKPMTPEEWDAASGFKTRSRL